MSDDKQHSFARHLAGLILVAVIIGCLAILWSSGPMFLRGTIFQDLFTIVYVVAAFGVLTLAERVASALVTR
ncbi:MAG: hypothetical protein QE284_02565 [Rhizobium sp.]|nr:hypothetical protein [Rhizobium sp.]